MRHDNISVYDGNLLAYNSGEKKYSGAMAGFLQQLIGDEEGKTKFVNFAIYPSSPPFTKSVHRVIFNKQNLKLRIHYLKPTVNTD